MPFKLKVKLKRQTKKFLKAVCFNMTPPPKASAPKPPVKEQRLLRATFQTELVSPPRATPPPSPVVEPATAQHTAEMAEIKQTLGQLLDKVNSMQEAVNKNESEMKKIPEMLANVIDASVTKAIRETCEKMKEEWRNDLKAFGQEMNQRFDKVEEEQSIEKKRSEMTDQRLEDERILREAAALDYAVRVRGLREDPQMNVVAEIVEAWKKMGGDGYEFQREIDRFYRVNSSYAKRRNLPRDLVIYFTKISTKNDF